MAKKVKVDLNNPPKSYLINDRYIPTPIFQPSDDMIEFIKDFGDRYDKMNNTNKKEFIIGRIKHDNPIIGGLPITTDGRYDRENDQIILQNSLDESTYAHEIAHKLNDSYDINLPRSQEERELIRKAYDTINGEWYPGQLDLERFATNTGLRKTISEMYNNAVGKELDNIILNLHPSVLLNLYDKENGYTDKNDYMTYTEDMQDIESWYNKIFSSSGKTYKDLSEEEKNRMKKLYDSKTTHAGLKIDKDKINVLKQALIKIAYNDSDKKQNDISYAKLGISTTQKQNKLKVKNGIAQPLGKGYYLMNGPSHEQGGIDIGKNLEVEGGEIVKLNPKSIKVLSNAKIMGDITPAEYALGGLKDGTFEDKYNKGFKYQEKFKDINGLNDDGTKARFGIKGKILDAYYRLLGAPKDYSNERAVLRDGTITDQCAKWSNDRLQKAGLNIFGDAWTRSSNKGLKKIYSGYDVSKRPKEYNKQEVIDYVLSAADSLAKTLDVSKLKQNDIVGLYSKRSPYQRIAYEKGTNGEAQSHTGHIEIEDGIPYVVHNVKSYIMKNKAEDLLGSDKPFGITSVYRKELGGQMKKKYKIDRNVNVPSTGEKIKAKYGTIDKLVNDFLDQTLDETNSTDYGTEFGLPSVSFTPPTLKVNDNSSIAVPEGYHKTKNGAIFKDFENKNINRLGLTTGDWINAGVNIGGALINLASRHSLPQKAIKYRSPIPLTAIKGKTKININPQLREIDKTINKYTDVINKNTASSQVSLNRLRDLNLNRLDMINKLYGQKENQETALINQDNRNLQNIINQNIQAQNIIDQKNLENEIQTTNLNRLERADAITDFIQNIAQTTGNVLSNVEKRKQFDKNLITMGLSYPNLNIDELLKVIGLR